MIKYIFLTILNSDLYTGDGLLNDYLFILSHSVMSNFVGSRVSYGGVPVPFFYVFFSTTSKVYGDCGIR